MSDGETWLIREIVELDKLCMGDILRSAGDKFEPARRALSLENELAAGAFVVGLVIGDRLAAYLQWAFTDSNAKVLSIQLSPNLKEFHRGNILAHLICAALPMIPPSFQGTVAALAHVDNLASIQLHLKLGFEEIARDSARIRFRANIDDIRKRSRGICDRHGTRLQASQISGEGRICLLRSSQKETTGR